MHFESQTAYGYMPSRIGKCVLPEKYVGTLPQGNQAKASVIPYPLVHFINEIVRSRYHTNPVHFSASLDFV